MDAIIVISILILLLASLYVIYIRRKFKKFKENPVGWKVKYWIASEDYVGTVISVYKCNITVRTHDGERNFNIDDVFPLYPN